MMNFIAAVLCRKHKAQYVYHIMCAGGAGKGIVRKGKRPSVYRIGFNDGDETELTANGINELEELRVDSSPEFECEPDNVTM